MADPHGDGVGEALFGGHLHATQNEAANNGDDGDSDAGDQNGFHGGVLPPGLLRGTYHKSHRWRNAALDRGCHMLRPRHILRRIDVEEGVDWLPPPPPARAAAAPGPPPALP